MSVLDEIRPEWDDLKESVQALIEENAKLRTWLSDVYTIVWSGLDCCECPWFAECDSDTGCAWMYILAKHMREVGIKVPQ